MSDFTTGLTDAQKERLYMLSEEAGEVVQAVGKILRHGYDNHHPDGGPTNRRLLELEINDLNAVAQAMQRGCDLRLNFPSDNVTLWRKKLKYTYHQVDA